MGTLHDRGDDSDRTADGHLHAHHQAGTRGEASIFGVVLLLASIIFVARWQKIRRGA